MADTLQLELAAIRDAAGIFPLDDRAFLRITGSDATRWLNGMVTNNIKDLAPGQGNFNFLLNAQGRILATCTIYRVASDIEPVFLLETDASQLNPIQILLDKFIIMDDVELAPAPELTTGIALLGSQAPEILTRLLALTLEPGTMRQTTVNGVTIVALAPPAATTPRYDLWFLSQQAADAAHDQLLALGVTYLSDATQEAFRILTRTPRYGQDIRNTDTHKDLPQETAQTHALHFSKGCYVGQEIVERIHSRGQVHRTFTQFRLTGDLPQLPAPLTANAKPVGELTSATQIGDQLIALGYIRREALSTPLTYTGGTAKVLTPNP